MPLEHYREKRDFEKTPEPPGAGRQGEPTGALLYVIQKHAASRLHYDFRLELDGVLLSWAVPKGPSLDPRDKRLAARVEDHPLEYGNFEGAIPAGEYGAGTVQLWDRGAWEPESDPHAGLSKGDLKFTLHGEKLKGSWVLVRMKGRPGEEGKENWLLIKHRDDHAVDGDAGAVLREHDRSVASGRTLDEIASEGEASVWRGGRAAGAQFEDPPGEEPPPDPSALSNARQAPELPRFVEPELATLVRSAPSGERWLHEVKYDGYRALSRIEGGRVEMRSRNNKDWTAAFASIAEELSRLPVESAMLDGEVVMQMPDGTTSFERLQSALGAERLGKGRRLSPLSSPRASGPAGGAPEERASGHGGSLVYYVFDLLYLNGYGLVESPIEQRKELLRRLLSRRSGGAVSGRVRYSEHVVGGGPEFLEEACTFGLEGVMSKAAGSRYQAGTRGTEWQKTKCGHEQEFVIGGFTDPAGTRVGFGALLLGVSDSDGLRYVGKVGTGFSDAALADLGRRLREMEVEASPFVTGLDRVPGRAHWVSPKLAATVAFSEWTNAGGIRHPSFRGLRDEEPAVSPVTRAARKSAPRESSRESVTLTHAGKVYWPRDGVTKQDLADYYEKVAPLMLPYVLGRPIATVRCPSGLGASAETVAAARGRSGPCFFNKHPAGDFKGPLEVVTIVESGGPSTYFTIREAAGLTALAQMGALEIHVWGATWPDIEHPDTIVFDFDPDPAVEWDALVDAAGLMRDVLGALGLQTFVRTTGGKGLHVVAPVRPAQDWTTVRGFSKAIADAFVATAPDLYTASMSKAKRAGKIYVDYVRNNRGATAIASYSTRAREHATVAVPLRWEELLGDARPASYTLGTIDARLRELTGDPWEGFERLRESQALTSKMIRAVGLG